MQVQLKDRRVFLIELRSRDAWLLQRLDRFAEEFEITRGEATGVRQLSKQG